MFIDEIHRLNHSVEEILYPALEDYALDFIIGKGPSAKSIRLSLPRFTLVGATTKAGRLSAPLRDRFGVHARLEMYSTEQLVKIVRNSSKVLETEIDAEAAAMLAGRSRGTPRIANRLLKRVRDFAQVKGEGRITPEITDFALSCMGIDELGLDGVDRNIILSMIDKFNGGPVGLETVAAASGEDAGTIEDVYEPYLLQIGFLARTPRGRVCLPAAYRHYGRSLSSDRESQISIFFQQRRTGRMKTELFDYYLPEELIAQEPVWPRDSSRLLVYDVSADEIRHRRFYQIEDELESGDVLVINNTKVIPARLYGKKSSDRRKNRASAAQASELHRLGGHFKAGGALLRKERNFCSETGLERG